MGFYGLGFSTIVSHINFLCTRAGWRVGGRLVLLKLKVK